VSRAILFAEVPSFYAAVARSDDPSLAGRPVIVGGDPRKRGLVQAATEEAMAAGVSVEMPVLQALKLCPRARAVRTDMARYREVSRRLFACLRRGVDRLEAFGLGAAYFDLSGAKISPEAIAKPLRDRVREELALPLRVGIGSGKFVARLAAEEAGEGGVRRIAPGEEAAFLRPLPVTRLDGVGRKTAAALAELGARAIGDVVDLGRERLEAVLGSHGLRIYACATGAGEEPVRAARHPQTLSRETTVEGESRDLGVLTPLLQELAHRLEAELRVHGLSAGRVALKVRYGDQVTTTRSQTLRSAASGAAEIHAVAVLLVGRTQAGSRAVRGLGIQLAKLIPTGEEDRQLELFSPSR
jgi:nucleotidyltransferase/DNA polymerase involved in DNA repair